MPLINKISNEVMKAHYLKKLAELLDTSLETVAKEAKRQSKTEKIYDHQKPAVKKPYKSRRESLEEYLLALILHSTSQFKEMIDQVAFAAATDEGRPVLTGVRLAKEGAKLILAATDGYRLSVKQVKGVKSVVMKKSLIVTRFIMLSIRLLLIHLVWVIIPRNRLIIVFFGRCFGIMHGGHLKGVSMVLHGMRYCLVAG